MPWHSGCLLVASSGWKTTCRIQGPGVGKPQGYFNANATIVGGGIAGGATRATANSIFYPDLAWMVSRLHSACWNRARCIVNTTTIPYLMAIQNSAGVFVYQPNCIDLSGYATEHYRAMFC